MVHRFVGFPTPSDPSALMGILPSFVQVNSSAPFRWLLLALLTPKSFYVLDMLSTLSLGFTRLSALFFYRRVFIVAAKWEAFGILSFSLIVIVTLWTLGYVLLQVFACGNRFWELLDPMSIQDCALNAFLESVPISSFILDVIVLVLPIPQVRSEHSLESSDMYLRYGVFIPLLHEN